MLLRCTCGSCRPRIQVKSLQHAPSLLKIVKITGVVATLWAAPLQAQTVSLSPAQVRNLAATALQNNDPRPAAIATDALLERFPDDPIALNLRTQAAILLGDYAGAVSYGKRAFFNSVTSDQRFHAARLIALAHAEQRQDSRAQLWLRAARQFAPTDRAAAAVAQDYQALSQRNPLSVNLRFGITPSTNINSGSANSETDLFNFRDSNGNLVLFDLSEDAQALSGWEYAASLNLRYRVRTDQRSATFLDFGLSGQTYTLTERSQDRIDESETDVKGSDFSNATLNFGVTHRFVLAPDANVTEAALSFAKTWSGGDPNRYFLTASASHEFSLTDNSSFTLSGYSQRQERIETGDQVAVLDIAGTYSMAIESVGSLSVGVGVRNSAAEDKDEDFDSIRYQIGFAPEAAFNGVNFGFNFSYEEREFDLVRLVGGPRSDTIKTFGMRAVFSDVEYFGFRPVLTAEHTQQDSSSLLFDRDYTEFGFDIVSSF